MGWHCHHSFATCLDCPLFIQRILLQHFIASVAKLLISWLAQRFTSLQNHMRYDWHTSSENVRYVFCAISSFIDLLKSVNTTGQVLPGWCFTTSGPGARSSRKHRVKMPSVTWHAEENEPLLAGEGERRQEEPPLHFRRHRLPPQASAWNLLSPAFMCRPILTKENTIIQ
jgi:hypothetical protein